MTITITIIRIKNEEETLLREINGYADLKNQYK